MQQIRCGEYGSNAGQLETKEIWFYDYRTNINHTLKKKPLKLSDLQEFITCYNAANSFKRVETYHAIDNPGVQMCDLGPRIGNKDAA